MPRTESAKVDLRAVRALAASPVANHEGLIMDLRYSHEDEAFRAEIRSWLDREVPQPR